ncbi:MAG: hypothetical protein ACM34K_19480 [Bacillota bacterium]
MLDLFRMMRRIKYVPAARKKLKDSLYLGVVILFMIIIGMMVIYT